MSKQISTIPVSGRLTDTKTGLHEAGDVYVYRRDDASGRYARSGGHTNLGYSGYFLASIFDGKKWRRLQINELIPYSDRSFELASSSPEVRNRIALAVLSWHGRCAEYIPSKRAFTIPSLKLPEFSNGSATGAGA
jgi:hypothetical protein